MKKQAVLLLAVFTLLVSAGCTPLPTAQPKEPPASQQNQQPSTAEPAQTDTQKQTQHVGAVVSLGDTMADWERTLGHPFSQGDSLKVYKNGRYQVVFENNKAVTITFTNKNGKITLTNDLLPKDGKKQSASAKEIRGMTMTVEKWYSDSLAAAIPETKGNYTIMKNKKGDTYDNIVVDCSPNLKK